MLFTTGRLISLQVELKCSLVGTFRLNLQQKRTQTWNKAVLQAARDASE